MWFAFADDWPDRQDLAPGMVVAMGVSTSVETEIAALLFLDQIKREKGVWWMPWQ